MGAGSSGSCLALVLGARPRWDGRAALALVQGVGASLLLGAVTVIGAIALFPLR